MTKCWHMYAAEYLTAVKMNKLLLTWTNLIPNFIVQNKQPAGGCTIYIKTYQSQVWWQADLCMSEANLIQYQVPRQGYIERP